MRSKQAEKIFQGLESLRIELPSWGFANTGTRFGKFVQPAAATTIEEKFSDAGQVHAVTGVCPTLALHVLWDLPHGLASCEEISRLAAHHGVRPGSINPNYFQEQMYKHGSFGNPDEAVRKEALQHTKESIAIAQRLASRDISLWFADGSNYPGTANIAQRKRWFEDLLKDAHAALSPDQRLFIEYKPFEPAFYHTDIADWGMALLLARAAGPQAKVLVDTGHHYAAQNIEQIVAWLLAENMLGGFHFNDRRYADDDLTMGSIDPYQVFRIFHEILYFRVAKRKACRYRLHDRSEPQFKGQNRGHDPNRRDGATALCKSVASRLQAPRCRAAPLRFDPCRVLFTGGLRHRPASRHPRMANFQRSSRGSDGRVPRKRLPRAHLS